MASAKARRQKVRKARELGVPLEPGASRHTLADAQQVSIPSQRPAEQPQTALTRR